MDENCKISRRSAPRSYFSDHEVTDLVRAHMTLVKQIARRYSQFYPDSYEDLVQVGSIGLLKAINYYDPTRSRAASFRTLAICYIRGEIRHYLRDQACIVQVPRKLTEINGQVSQLEEKLTKMLNRVPTVQELSQYSGFTVAEILEAQQSWEARLHYESLDGSDEDEREEHRGLSEVVADRKYQELLRLSEDRELLTQALKKLGEKTRQIVEFVFFYDLSQKETAVVLGVSEMGVSRAVHTALKRLKDIIDAEKSAGERQHKGGSSKATQSSKTKRGNAQDSRFELSEDEAESADPATLN